MLIINPAELATEKQLKIISLMELDVISRAEKGEDTTMLRINMRAETTEYLRMTHPILHKRFSDKH